MKVRRIRVAELRKGTVRVIGREAHHLARVLRARAGDPVLAFDGAGREADGRIEAIEDAAVVLIVGPPRVASVEAPVAVTVVVALLKGDKLAQVVRQATELGASAVRPVVTARCDVPRLSPSKAERLRRVAAEAAKQSGRAVVPVVHDPVPLAQVHWDGPAVVADPRAAKPWSELDPGEAVSAGAMTVITGPEGGFAPEEIDALEDRGVRPVRLGARILRAETAPLALLAALLSRVDE